MVILIILSFFCLGRVPPIYRAVLPLPLTTKFCEIDLHGQISVEGFIEKTKFHTYCL